LSNIGNVSVRSSIGEPRAVLYEDDGEAAGNSTDLKRLKYILLLSQTLIIFTAKL
jgi:hypothetical protein